MSFKIKCYLFFIIFLSILSGSCSLGKQIKEYTTYQVHDIKGSNNGIIVLLEKKRSSPEISLQKSIFGIVPQGTRYRLISYAFLIFDENNVSEKNDIFLNIKNKKNLITKKDTKYMNILSIINENSIISWYDFQNDIHNMSIIFINDDRDNILIISNDDDRSFCKSINNKKIMYLSSNKMFIYDLENYSKIEFDTSRTGDNYNKIFKNTNYMSDDGKWFFDRVGEDLSIMSYIYEIVDKENNVVFGRFPTKSRNFQAFEGDLENGRLLTYDLRYGLEIIDLKGNSLYSLQDDSFKYIRDAVFHKGKVYAAGITTESSELGKKDYIEIIQWDYKNDSVIKKYYPCDSPELEM